MTVPVSRVIARPDVLRLAGWICANAVAGLFSGLLIPFGSLLVAGSLFAVVLGLLQSAAVGRTWHEAFGWTAMTVMGLAAAMMLVVIPLFGTVYSVREVWLAAALLGLPLGAAMGLAQGLVLAMRDLPPRAIAAWAIGNAIAVATVAAIAFVGPTTEPVTGNVARTAYGIAFGVLTALPLTFVLRETRAAES